MRLAGRGAGGSGHDLFAGVAALERTALAWERTAISLAALGTVVFKIPQAGTLLRAGALAMIATAVVLVLVVVPLGYHRARAQVVAGGPQVRLHGRDSLLRLVLITTAGVVALAAGLAIFEALVTL